MCRRRYEESERRERMRPNTTEGIEPRNGEKEEPRSTVFRYRRRGWKQSALGGFNGGTTEGRGNVGSGSKAVLQLNALETKMTEMERCGNVRSLNGAEGPSAGREPNLQSNSNPYCLGEVSSGAARICKRALHFCRKNPRGGSRTFINRSIDVMDSDSGKICKIRLISKYLLNFRENREYRSNVRNVRQERIWRETHTAIWAKFSVGVLQDVFNMCPCKVSNTFRIFK